MRWGREAFSSRIVTGRAVRTVRLLHFCITGNCVMRAVAVAGLLNFCVAGSGMVRTVAVVRMLISWFMICFWFDSSIFKTEAGWRTSCTAGAASHLNSQKRAG